MEFFCFAAAAADPNRLRESLTVDALPGFCAAVDDVGGEEELGRVVYFAHWGRYHLRRETIMGGVRFTVPDCPNALAWTVTAGFPPRPEMICLHATINRTEHDEEFIAATRDLLDCLRAGLEAAWGAGAGESPRGFTGTVFLEDLRGKA